MNLVLGTNEKEVRSWNYIDRDDNLEFNNDVVVTDKRFIYQRKLNSADKQNSISRYEVPLQNVKAMNAFYGSKQSCLWLVVAFIGIIMFAVGLINLFSEILWAETMQTELYVFEPIILILLGIVVSAVGLYFQFNPEKSPIKVKKPVFSIVIETNNIGKKFALGAGNDFSLKSKSSFNLKTILLFIPPICVVGIPYYFVKKANNSCKLEIPEEYALEIIDTIGSAMF